MPYGPGNQYILLGEDVTLDIRQQPEHALVTQVGKEKGRKPVDPPPIVQMRVKAHVDPNRNWLCSPHVFMCASPLEGSEGETQISKEKIVGQQVSSLHRLKDITDEDGGFFVFGDISLRGTGTHRLKFDLYNLENGQAVFLVSVISQPFEVVTNKDFKGLSESSHLSRTFSDQGVRLRLRKEPRSLAGGGVKRNWQSPEEYPARQLQRSMAHTAGGSTHNYAQYGPTPGIKRQRSDSDEASPSQYSQQYPPNNTRAMYGTSTLVSSPSWGGQVQQQQGYMGGQASGSTSYMASPYQMGPGHMQWQRGLPNAPVSAPLGGAAAQIAYARRSSGQYFQPQPQQSAQYTGPVRPQTQHSSSSYPDLGDLQTPNSLPNTAQSHNYLASNENYSNQIHSLHSAMSSTEQEAYQQQTPSSMPDTKWPTDSGRILPVSAPAGVYSSSSHQPSSGVPGQPFDPAPQTSGAQYTQAQQAAVQNLYSGMNRVTSQYPQSSTLAANTMPALTANFPTAATEPDWSGYSPQETSGTPLTGQALAQHEQQLQQHQHHHGYTSTQQTWQR